MDGVSRTLSYQWDAGGRRTRVTHPDGSYFGYAYDPAGRLTGVSHFNGSLMQVFLYDAAGRPWATVRTTEDATVYGYDGLSRPSTLTHYLPDTSADVTLGFTYNPAGQIASRTQSNDAYAWTRHRATNRPYDVNGLNQYGAAGGTTFAYDANGNLISETPPSPDPATGYTYDVENRLVAASGARTAALRYDPLGRLYEVAGTSGTTRFLYDGDALVAEYDAAGARRDIYVHAGGADTPFIWFTTTDLRFLHADQQGSIVAVSSSTNNAMVAVNAYDEYGIPGAGNVGRFQYTGQAWLAELGMYHYKARIYSPTLGRFLQTDPVGYQDQFNLYAYIGNDPVNGTDPSGTVRCDTSKNAQCTEVHSAARAARAAALQARNDLRSLAGAIGDGTELTTDQQSILGTFERKFGAGTGTASNLNAAATHFDRVATSIGVEGAGLRARFRSDAFMGNAIASVRLNSSEINIGSRFFGPNMSAVRPFVVLHEAGHSLGLEDTILPANAPQGIGHYSLRHIRAYGVRATDWLGANAPSQARINNDNYNCFAMPICGGL